MDVLSKPELAFDKQRLKILQQCCFEFPDCPVNEGFFIAVHDRQACAAHGKTCHQFIEIDQLSN